MKKAFFSFIILMTSIGLARADNLINNSGTVIPVTSYSESVWPANEGQNYPQPREIEGNDNGLYPKSSPNFPGFTGIIGADNRVNVSDTTEWPFRASVYIRDNVSWCSGFMVSPNTVVTAAHCVYDISLPGWYSLTRVTPAKNGTLAPYGNCTVKKVYMPSGYIDTSGSAIYDYAIIKLNCNIGNVTGWLGFWTQTTSLVGLSTGTSGYPSDKPRGTQWRSSGSVQESTNNLVYFNNDMYEGQSGSPLRKNQAGCGWCAMAIVTNSFYGTVFPSNFNFGRRINQTVFNRIRTVIDLP